MDFSQEWLSARNYLAGTPVYANQTESLFRHTGLIPLRPEDMLPWNAHPPAAVVLALPFGWFDYPTAHLLWNVLTFPLFLIGVCLIIREMEGQFGFKRLFPMVVLLLLFAPLYMQLAYGQLNCLIFFLLTMAWLADRRKLIGWAGVAVGLATALKLFPGLAFAYFLSAGRRKAIATGAVAFLSANIIALAMFGPTDFQTYVREVIPSLSRYQSWWCNLSLSAFWMRLFNPSEQNHIIPLFSNPNLARILFVASIFLVTAAVAYKCLRATSTSERDRAFAACLVGMVLVSPVAWDHYIVLLMLPIWLVWMCTPAGPLRLLMWLALIDLWITHKIYVVLILGPQQAEALAHGSHAPLSPAINLGLCSLYTYGLVTLFLLVLASPAGNEEESPSISLSEPHAVDLDRRLFGASVREAAAARVDPVRPGNKMVDSRSRQETQETR
jgi:hypothetical protein